MQQQQTINPSLKTALISLSSIQGLIYLIFLGFYIRRINKLDKQASVSSAYLPKDKTKNIKIVLLFCLVILCLIHILLSELDQAYWMHQMQNLALVDILGILDFTLQMYILGRQHKKKSRRTRALPGLWLVLVFIWIVQVVIVGVYMQTPGIVLLVFNVLCLALLLAFTFKTQQTPELDIQMVQDSTRNTKLLPIIGDAQRASFSHFNRIYIEFNKDFQVNITDKDFEFFFKIAVFVGGQSHIVTKTQIQFLQLVKKMQEIFPNSEVVSLKASNRVKKGRESNVMKSGEDKQKIYENYLIQLTKDCQFYIDPLLNFLKISPAKKGALTKWKGSLLKKDTIKSSDDQDHLSQPFFTVKSKNNKIYVSNHQILQIIVNKTDAQIRTFHSRLITQNRLKIQLLSQCSQLSQYMYFIDRIVNSKNLWRYFAEWMCLGSAIQDKIFNMFDFWNWGFQQIQVNVIGHEVTFDKQGSVISLYLLSLINKNQTDKGTTLKKRFKDFVKLDASLHKFVTQRNLRNVQLPALPPKISPFGSKTSPTARQVYLNVYLKQVIKIQGINHCIKLLEFLGVDKDVVAEQLSNHGEQSLQFGMILSGKQFSAISRSNTENLKKEISKSHEQSRKKDEDQSYGEKIFSKIKLEELQLR